MSYSIYVTRADHSFETEEHPILESEWLAVSSKDASLRRDMQHHYGRIGKSGEEEIFYPWVWSEHPEGSEILFWFQDGAVHSTNADDYTIEKMYELAVQLNAKVLDDDDHVYDPERDKNGSENFENKLNEKESDRDIVEKKLAALEARQKKPWWMWFFETK